MALKFFLAFLLIMIQLMQLFVLPLVFDQSYQAVSNEPIGLPCYKKSCIIQLGQLHFLRYDQIIKNSHILMRISHLLMICSECRGNKLHLGMVWVTFFMKNVQIGVHIILFAVCLNIHHLQKSANFIKNIFKYTAIRITPIYTFFNR